ncbi:MAG: SRPBCC family protein [Acidimicrobiia bacterium]
MELVNDFTVNAPISETWATLTDLEKIAPCMPGAQLTEIEGETYRGLVKVKVGPITAQFKGQAHFLERDEDGHRASLKAEGRDTGGKGNASAIITAQLESVSETSTKCTVTTDLTITGKVAQFGRGALADVSDKLLKQFVHNLETTVLNEPLAGAVSGDAEAKASATLSTAESAAVAAPVAGAAMAADATITPAATAEPTAAPAAAATSAPTVRTIEGKPVEPIDLLETAGGTVLKRLAPLALLAIVLYFLLRRRRS